MRILIVSDLHGNLEALEAITEPRDELWVLGDLVNYGPNPSEVIDFVRRNAALVVRGNHDHAVGHGVDPRCSASFREMARVMQAYTESVLSDEDKAFLRELPVDARRTVDGLQLHLCHASPSDPLFRYLPPDAPEWPGELKRTGADVLLVGHTHLPFQLDIGGRWIVNPGSAGQPKHGAPHACYAVWEEGRFRLESRPYRTGLTAGKLRSLPVSGPVVSQLVDVLINGGLSP